MTEDTKERPPGSRPPADAGDGDGAVGRDEETRHSLYVRASELDIPGRSRMNKEQLSVAVREAT
ncbi:MAG: hypothetical protein V9E83_07540 [Baekduia sp.]